MRIWGLVLKAAALNVALIGTASALTIAPTVPPSDVAVTCSGGTSGGSDAEWIATYCAAMSGTTLAYKDNVGGSEEGPLAGSYDSVFNADASGGTITYTGGNALLCTVANPCWLLIKDGNNDPFRYAFNLTNVWNGTETINLTGFWPAGGAISHWSLYGGTGTPPPPPPDVPEPGTLALLGLGLIGLGLSRRRK